MERRVWVRFPCGLDAPFQVGDIPSATRLQAVARNVSRGGINLLVDKPFDPGAVLSIELPAGLGDAPASVLAYVVHSHPQPGGRWSVGCAFAAELEDEDLRLFAARRQRTVPPDQRAWVRFPCEVRASFRMLLADTPKHYPAQVINISPRGVGLLVEQTIDVGAVLRLDLQGKDERSQLSVLVCVVRATAQTEGLRSLGCTFQRELSEEEIARLR